MSEKLNVYQKIIEVRKVAKNFNKDAKGFNFQYVSGDQVLSKIMDKMNEVGLLFIPNIKEDSLNLSRYTYINSKSKEVTESVVIGEMTYKWVNAENPEDILEIKWGLIGQQTDPSQALGTALTYSERYMLLKLLGVPTDGDNPEEKPLTENKEESKQVKNVTQYKLSEKQKNRYYMIALNKGMQKKDADNLLEFRYGKTIDNLSKEEYDKICAGIEKEPEKTKIYYEKQLNKRQGII